jgi:uncharacterized protein
MTTTCTGHRDDERLFRRHVLLHRPALRQRSLTDFISFIIMQDNGLTDALTGDHHFEQAGLNILMK